jgi:hypothetical protein
LVQRDFASAQPTAPEHQQAHYYDHSHAITTCLPRIFWIARLAK